jgi:hypothetical protein
MVVKIKKYRERKMKTIVEIEWDLPKEQAWLCADNISIALHAYCQNTKFKVRSLKKGLPTTSYNSDCAAALRVHRRFLRSDRGENSLTFVEWVKERLKASTPSA